MIRHGLAVAALLVGTLPAGANAIERACNRSDRQGATPQLCACIAGVADATLTRRDIRVAARFFEDPQRAQDIRQSDRPRDEAFWDRYRVFGTSAERACS